MSAVGPGRRLLLAAGVVVALAAGAAVWVMGVPGTQRLVRMDERRAMDLQALETQIGQYQEREGRLPGNLEQLAAQPGVRLALTDPQDGRPYGYVPGEGRRYRLCAVFATDTAVTGAWNPRWLHGVGETCFEREAAAKQQALDMHMPPPR